MSSVRIWTCYRLRWEIRSSSEVRINGALLCDESVELSGLFSCPGAD